LTGDEPDGAGTPRRSVLGRLQCGLETLYRIDTQLAVEHFLIGEGERAEASPARAPREQVLLRQHGDDEVGLGLFVDEEALSNLERHDPGEGLDDRNFADFCVAIDGVSHFVYLARCAAEDRRVSALELELQAEVDKFACCTLLATEGLAPANDVSAWRRRLYDEVTFAKDLDVDEHARYRVANAEAGRYARALDARYLASRRVPEMLPELRRFYRLDLDGKLGHIARFAA
jgi:hypothetical protein